MFDDTSGITSLFNALELVDRVESSVNGTEQALSNMNAFNAALKSKQPMDTMLNAMDSASINSLRKSEAQNYHTQAARAVNQMATAQYLPTKDGNEAVLLNEFSARYHNTAQALGVDGGDKFIDVALNDIDWAKVSNVQKFSAIKIARNQQLISLGVTDYEERDNQNYEYFKEEYTPLVADIMFQRNESVPEEMFESINDWLNKPSDIGGYSEWMAASQPYTEDYTTGNVLPNVLGLVGEAGVHRDLDKGFIDKPNNATEQEVMGVFGGEDYGFTLEEKRKSIMLGTVAGGLFTIPLMLSGAPVAVAAASIFDITTGLPAVFTGKDPVEQVILGTEKSEPLPWWGRALYGLGAVAGIGTAVKVASPLQKEVLSFFKATHGESAAAQTVIGGRQSTEAVFSASVMEENFLELTRFADSYTPLNATDTELLDMLSGALKGEFRVPSKIMEEQGGLTNPIIKQAMIVAESGDEAASKMLYDTVTIALERGNDGSITKAAAEAIEALGGHDTGLAEMITRDFRSAGKYDALDQEAFQMAKAVDDADTSMASLDDLIETVDDVKQIEYKPLVKEDAKIDLSNLSDSVKVRINIGDRIVLPSGDDVVIRAVDKDLVTFIDCKGKIGTFNYKNNKVLMPSEEEIFLKHMKDTGVEKIK